MENVCINRKEKFIFKVSIYLASELTSLARRATKPFERANTEYAPSFVDGKVISWHKYYIVFNIFLNNVPALGDKRNFFYIPKIGYRNAMKENFQMTPGGEKKLWPSTWMVKR